MSEIGPAGQSTLLRGKVLVVGAGGLGSPASLYLAAAGVGTIGIVDHDTVDVSNLQRQVVHSTRSVGHPKVDSARRTLTALNTDVRIIAYRRHLSPHNAASIIRHYDFVIDATDNFESKFIIAEACHSLEKPYSHAGVSRFTGQTMTVLPGQTCCVRCVFLNQPEADSTDSPPQGPVGAVPGVIGSVQAMEAIKYLLGIGDLLLNRLLIYDALGGTFRSVTVRTNPWCPLCGTETHRRKSGKRRPAR